MAEPAPKSRLREVHFAHTSDGWRLALHRYRPALVRAPHPVVLCPGIACNSRFFDLEDGGGLAPFLRGHGFDVWVLDPRGRGLSKRRDKGTRFHWHFDDYVFLDLPACIRKVLQISGAQTVDWVGHSQGGMVAYAYAMQGLKPALNRLVAVGSPTFRVNDFWGWRLAHAASAVLVGLPHVPFRRLAPFAAGIVAGLSPWLPVPMYNSRNMERRAIHHLLAKVLDDISGRELRQGLRFIRERGFRSTSGPLRYAECFGRLRIPFLVIAGSEDQLAPPEDVRRAYQSSHAPIRSFHCVGRGTGAGEEYGHVDLLLGKRVDTEVFPLILSWLQAG